MSKKLKKYMVVYGDVENEPIIYWATSSNLLNKIQEISDDYGIDNIEDITVYEIAGKFENFDINVYHQDPEIEVVIKDSKGKKP